MSYRYQKDFLAVELKAKAAGPICEKDLAACSLYAEKDFPIFEQNKMSNRVRDEYAAGRPGAQPAADSKSES